MKSRKKLLKVNNKLQFVYRQNQFLYPKLENLSCNSLMQPHLHYVYQSWYSLINQKLVKPAHFCYIVDARPNI